MKRRIIWLLLMCLAFSQSAMAYNLSEPGSYPVVDEPVTLKFLCRYYSEGSGQLDYATNDVTKFMEELTNVQIQWEFLPAEDAATKLNLKLVSGDYPDVLFEASAFATQSNILEWSEEGIILPLNDLIAKHAPNYTKILAEREDIRIATTAPDGNIYSFARTDGGIHIINNPKIFMYSPWVDQYLNAIDKTEIKTTQDFKDMLIYFRDTDMNGNGDATDEIPMSGTGVSFINALLNPFVYGNSYYLDDGKITANYNQEGYREGLRYIKSLWDEGLLDPEMFTQNRDIITAKVNQDSENKMIVGGFCDLWDGAYINSAIIPFETYKAIAPLEGPNGIRQATYNKADVAAGYGVVFKTCPYPEVFVQWMDYLYSYEGTMLMAYGIEGVSWEWTTDFPSLDGDPKSVARTEPVNTLYERNVQWIATAPCYRTPAIKYLETAQPGQSGASLYNSSMLYLPYSDPEKAIPKNMWLTLDQNMEQAQFSATIDTYVSEMAAAFVTGGKSLDDDWDTYVEQLNAMGLKRYIELQQEIYDANTK
ncbi:MAG: extracellular solute-binding protein [Christensenellales bacterium]|jgi:putative aldouronate transport system substrate-binding protein